MVYTSDIPDSNFWCHDVGQIWADAMLLSGMFIIFEYAVLKHTSNAPCNIQNQVTCLALNKMSFLPTEGSKSQLW